LPTTRLHSTMELRSSSPPTRGRAARARWVTTRVPLRPHPSTTTLEDAS
jgi:hypothetical protein